MDKFCFPRRFIRGSLLAFCLLIIYLLYNAEDVTFLTRDIEAVPSEESCHSKMHNDTAVVDVMNDTQSVDLVKEGPPDLIRVEDVINESTLKSPVLVTCVNKGFLDFLDNFLCSISHVQFLQNILIICEDVFTYNFLSGKFKGGPVRVAVTSQKYSPEGTVDRFTKDYREFMQKRVSYVEMLLRNNLDVFYVDTDVVLLQNPLLHFASDFDAFVQIEIAGSIGSYCSGFFYMKSTPMTKRFVRDWQSQLSKDPKGNQIAFAGTLRQYKNRNLLKVKSLPHEQFSSGSVFFASDVPWQKRQPPVVTVHANWIVGHDQKKQKLKDANLWFINGTQCI